MLWRTFCAEWKRCFVPGKMITLFLGIVILLLASCTNQFINYFSFGKEFWNLVGAVDFLEYRMIFDVFKVVIVMVLSSMYTASFCKDLNSQYLRHILCRTDLYTYSIARFLVNLCGITVVTILAFYGFTLAVMSMGFPLISYKARGGLIAESYYIDFVKACPVGYIGFMGLQLGVAAALCSSIGLLFSAYQPNAFVSIGSSTLVFYVLMSAQILRGTIFDFLSIVGMSPVFPTGYDTPRALSIAWGLFFPSGCIAVCCQLFYRKLKRRKMNGEL